ncbi:hypothetical protein D3C83_62640 [compost metagenome]
MPPTAGTEVTKLLLWLPAFGRPATASFARERDALEPPPPGEKRKSCAPPSVGSEPTGS